MECYSIIKFEPCSIDVYGDVILVYANNINLGINAIRKIECNETELFVISPYDYDTLGTVESIVNEERSGEVWCPEMTSFHKGVIILPDGSVKQAHCHFELEPNDSRIKFLYMSSEVSFDQRTWNKLAEGDEWGYEWRFTLDDIHSPYGSFNIFSFREVRQNGLVGIQLDVSGSLSVKQLPGYSGNDEEIPVSTIAVVRQPHNVWLWIHLFDENGQYVAAFSGTEKNAFSDDFPNYISELKRSYLIR